MINYLIVQEFIPVKKKAQKPIKAKVAVAKKKVIPGLVGAKASSWKGADDPANVHTYYFSVVIFFIHFDEGHGPNIFLVLIKCNNSSSKQIN